MNNDRLRGFARQMRKDPTPAEKRLWRLVRGRRLAGFRFRRQHPVGPFIADFYCAVAALAVELDGESHLGREAADQERDRHFADVGVRALRFPDGEVFDNPDGVVEVILRVCVERTAANPRVGHWLDPVGRFRPEPG